MLALNAQAQAFQPSPIKTLSSAKVAVEAPWKAALRLHLAPPDEPLGFAAGSSSNGHSATDALLNTARRFTGPTFHPSVYDWDAREDHLVVSWKMPLHRYQRQERLVFKGYNPLAVGDERRFPGEFYVQQVLANVRRLQKDKAPSSPNGCDESGTSTPSLGSSGPPTPEEKAVVTPPTSDDEDILWVLNEGPALKRRNAIKRLAGSSKGAKLIGKGLMAALNA